MFRQLSYQASHDTLTGLINRREFENCLTAAIEEIKSNSEQTHALLYIDLDQFKVVNDTFGHVAGDALLRQISDLIQGNILDIGADAYLIGVFEGVMTLGGAARAIDVELAGMLPHVDFTFSFQNLINLAADDTNDYAAAFGWRLRTTFYEPVEDARRQRAFQAPPLAPLVQTPVSFARRA